jgi:hypothetical protein
MALIFLYDFRGCNKNEIFADYWDHGLLHSETTEVRSSQLTALVVSEKTASDATVGTDLSKMSKISNEKAL